MQYLLALGIVVLGLFFESLEFLFCGGLFIVIVSELKEGETKTKN